MSYSDITFNDPNPIKRWLQNRRLLSAIHLANRYKTQIEAICDYGAGNGELCILFRNGNTDAEIFIFEPTNDLINEARENLASFNKVIFTKNQTELPSKKFDIVFCLEVFEHLPEAEACLVINEIKRIMNPTGIAIIGVPVETGIPALYKGIFRMVRRFGAYDATPFRVLSATLGFAPKIRPVAEISPGFQFHFYHLGFQHKNLKKKLNQEFIILNESYSPLNFFGYLFSPEVYFTITHCKS